jgi:hypothetical protein
LRIIVTSNSLLGKWASVISNGNPGKHSGHGELVVNRFYPDSVLGGRWTPLSIILSPVALSTAMDQGHKYGASFY